MDGGQLVQADRGDLLAAGPDPAALRALELRGGLEGRKGVSNAFSIFLENSLFISVLAIVGNVFSCSLAAFAFARLNFFGRRIAYVTMLVTLMLPTHVTLVPQYILFNKLGWVNTFYPLFVPHFFAVDAFFVLLMVQFIRSLP
ncbi:MAG TPA: hypothetical protein VFF46_34475, partial [Kribbella sp.]|nr:hypothetical protein [Kribbella sp.]